MSLLKAEVETNEWRRKKRVKLNDDVYRIYLLWNYLFIIYYCFDETAAGLKVEILMRAYVHVDFIPRSVPRSRAQI